MGKEHKLYRYNDKILFRKCHLSESEQLEFGDCTNFNSQKKIGANIIFVINMEFIFIVQNILELNLGL